MKRMKNILALVIASLIVAIGSSCSSIANKPIDQRVPTSVLKSSDGTGVIYLTDVQSVPTPILEQSLALWALNATNQTSSTPPIPRSFPVEVAVGLANNAIQLAPQLTEQYIESRRSTGTLSREAYISGINDKATMEAAVELIRIWTDNQNRSIINNHN